jgi:hypothetical protein
MWLALVVIPRAFIALGRVVAHPYFTSDYPIALEPPQDRLLPVVCVVPLAPDLAVRVTPNPKIDRRKPDLTFSALTCVRRGQKRQSVIDVNRKIVRCAEDLVFYRDDCDWVVRFIEKNRNYRIEADVEMVSVGGRQIRHLAQKVQDRAAVT